MIYLNQQAHFKFDFGLATNGVAFPHLILKTSTEG